MGLITYYFVGKLGTVRFHLSDEAVDANEPDDYSLISREMRRAIIGPFQDHVDRLPGLRVAWHAKRCCEPLASIQCCAHFSEHRMETSGWNSAGSLIPY
jgi:hypothetical protein